MPHSEREELAPVFHLVVMNLRRCSMPRIVSKTFYSKPPSSLILSVYLFVWMMLVRMLNRFATTEDDDAIMG